MTKSVRLARGLCASAALFALPACSTKEIGIRPLVVSENNPSADHGGLLIAFAPRTNSPTGKIGGYVYMDGLQLATDLGILEPLFAFEGQASSMGYLPAGRHHFELKEPKGEVGGPTFFAGDGEIGAGATTALYLFGPPGAVQGRFALYPAVVALGTVHVSLVNLVGTGQRLEVVGCVEGSPCTPLSPPLALGETFAGDVPLDAKQDSSDGRFMFSNGAALGYRQVPTGSVPDPPVQPLSHGSWTGGTIGGVAPPLTTLLAAPYSMSTTGDLEGSF